MNLKILSAVLVALGTTTLATTSYAANCDTGAGFYIGGQAGYGKADYGLSDAFKHTGIKKDEGGFSGRGYAGYQINQYFGIETGYTYFSDNTYKFSGVDTFNNPINGKLTYQTQQWDILAKVGTPFENSGFRGDIKAGAAYVMSKADANISSSSPYFPSVKISESNNKLEPAAGASVGYNFNQNFAMDVSYLHAFGSGNKSDAPSTDLVTLGVSYRFA
jgi:opacity protein-like surface antigen